MKVRSRVDFDHRIKGRGDGVQQPAKGGGKRKEM